MSDSKARPEAPVTRRTWIAPVLTRHQSLTALTQAQDPFAEYPPGANPYGPGISPYDVPCSGGFCP